MLLAGRRGPTLSSCINPRYSDSAVAWGCAVKHSATTWSSVGVWRRFGRGGGGVVGEVGVTGKEWLSVRAEVCVWLTKTAWQ